MAAIRVFTGAVTQGPRANFQGVGSMKHRASPLSKNERIGDQQMSGTSDLKGALVIPTLRYRDASAAVKWLSEAFGFEKHLVVPDDRGGIAHAELTFGNGMIMLGSTRDDAFSRLQKTPAEVGGVGTASPYIIVADVDAHHRRAAAAGAQIVYGPKNEDYGGRGYSCRDPEGHLWNFGTYDPWAPRDREQQP